MAIQTKEDDWEPLFSVVNTAPRRVMDVPDWLETCLVSGSRANFYAPMRLDVVFGDLRIGILPLDAPMAELARFAQQRHGKGSKHLGKLIYGDCMTYTTTKIAGEPLLSTGSDFIHTDIERVVC